MPLSMGLACVWVLCLDLFVLVGHLVPPGGTGCRASAGGDLVGMWTWVGPFGRGFFFWLGGYWVPSTL